MQLILRRNLSMKCTLYFRVLCEKMENIFNCLYTKHMTNECFGYIKYKLPLTLNLPASFYFAIWLPEHLNCLPHRPPVLCFLATPGSSEQSWSKGTAIGLCVASALQPVMFDCGVGKIENLSIRTLKVFHSLKRWESLTAHLHMVFSSSYQYKKKKSPQQQTET